MKVIFIPLLLLLTACGNKGNNNQTASSEDSKIINLEEGNSCSYSGTLDMKSAYSFNSDADAENALKSIMKHTGLPTNFLLVAADVDNAAAAVYKNQRYILYSQRFMEEVEHKTGSKFGALSILSHEIGHHLSGHTLLEADARPNLELEADRFSGFILAKMGASMEEACVAMDAYGSNTASDTHPAKRTRIAAIVNGWKEAVEDNQKNTVKEVVSPATNEGVYVTAVQSKEQFITLRRRSLSPDEFRLGNSGTQEGERLNQETIITNLVNGTEVEVLSSIGQTYYVKARTPKGEVLGYIVKSFAGKPTIIQVRP